MKIKKYWMISLPLLLTVFVLVYLTNGFSANFLSLPMLILPALALVVTLGYIWNYFTVKPAEDFVRTINRAIHGDFRARFSCGRENTNFYPLSQSFNQFMTVMERQTNELTQNRHLQNQLYENEKVYRTALELTCERVFEADLIHNKFLYGQDSYNKIFPFLETELYDEIIKSIAENATHEDDAEKYYQTFCRSNLMNLFASGETTEVNLEYRQKTLPYGTQWVAATVILLSGNDDDSMTAIGYVKNIDERKQRELEILKQSQKDGLTGIYNKLVTQSFIESFLSGEGRDGTHAAIMLDIDNFKHINDSLGHIEGDYALAQVACHMQNLFRSSDVLGRIGGDEFFVLLKNYSSIESLQEKLGMLSAMFRQIYLGRDGSYSISGSIGVALYPQDGAGYGELYQKADIALYYSKEHGKNRYTLYKDMLEEETTLEKERQYTRQLY